MHVKSRGGIFPDLNKGVLGVLTNSKVYDLFPMLLLPNLQK